MHSSLLMTFLPEFKENKLIKPSDHQKEELKKELKDKISILAVSYHNLAVQQEYLKMYYEALENYRLASEFSYKYFGKDNGIH